MEKNRRPGGETAAIILSIAGAAVLAIVGIAVVAGIVVGTILNVQTGLGAWAEGYREYRYSSPKSYVASSDFALSETVSEVNVNWVSGNVTFKNSSDGGVHVYEISDSADSADAMRYKFSGGKLTVKFRDSGNYKETLAKDLVVELPGGNAEEIILNTASSEVVLEDISCEEIYVNCVSGSVTLDNVSCGDFDIKTVSSDVICSLSVQPDEADIETVTGGVELSLKSEPEDLSLESAAGDITVNGAESHLKYESESASGSGEIEVTTVSGNIAVNF